MISFPKYPRQDSAEKALITSGLFILRVLQAIPGDGLASAKNVFLDGREVSPSRPDIAVRNARRFSINRISARPRDGEIDIVHVCRQENCRSDVAVYSGGKTDGAERVGSIRLNNFLQRRDG